MCAVNVDRSRESRLLYYYYYYYYSSSSNLRAHGVCDYGTLPIMRQDLSSYLTTYIYKYIRPFRMIFFLPYHRQAIQLVGWYGAVVKAPCPEACTRSGELYRLCIRKLQLTQFS